MRCPIVRVSLFSSMLLLGAAPALACGDYGGYPAATGYTTSDPGPAPAATVIINNIVPADIDVTGSMAGPGYLRAAPLLPDPRSGPPECLTQRYVLARSVVRVHRCYP